MPKCPGLFTMRSPTVKDTAERKGGRQIERANMFVCEREREDTQE